MVKGTITWTRYIDEDGEEVVTKHYFVDGVEVNEHQWDELLPPPKPGVPGGHKQGLWPMKGSTAMGVAKTQIAEAMAHDAKLGVPTEYTEGGRPIFRDRGHRKAFLKVHKAQDCDGSYGD